MDFEIAGSNRHHSEAAMVRSAVGTELHAAPVRQAESSQILRADEDLVSVSAGQRVGVAMDHGVELLAAPRGDTEHIQRRTRGARRKILLCVFCGFCG